MRDDLPTVVDVEPTTETIEWLDLPAGRFSPDETDDTRQASASGRSSGRATAVAAGARTGRERPPRRSRADGLGSFPSEAELIIQPDPTRVAVVLVAAGLGMLVSIGVGVYGRLHEPTSTGISLAGFASAGAAKSWLASAVFVLALAQLGLAGAGRRTGAARWYRLHRYTGRVAVLLSVPVAVHCLYAMGFQTGSTRVLIHSVAGCFIYGVFTAKMLVLPRNDAPRWAVPLLGGLLFSALAVVWLTSALWFFTVSGTTG